MRIIIKRLLGCAVILALAAVMLAKAADITELKLCRNKFHNFFEHAEDFDVLFIGSSHMVNGVFPLELWHDYGITSFNLGGHANHIPTTYWEYMNALDYADPDISKFHNPIYGLLARSDAVVRICDSSFHMVEICRRKRRDTINPSCFCISHYFAPFAFLAGFFSAFGSAFGATAFIIERISASLLSLSVI